MSETVNGLIYFIVAGGFVLAVWYLINRIIKAHKTGKVSGRYGLIYDKKQMPVFFWLALLMNYVFVIAMLAFSISICGSLILNHFHSPPG